MEQRIFAGPFFDFVLENTPLRGAKLFTSGSSAVLFEKEGATYRLTSDAIGHDFLSWASSRDEATVRIIRDHGPVAPLDDHDVIPTPDPEQYYWLAQVERLEDIPQPSSCYDELTNFFEHFSDEDLIHAHEVPELIQRIDRFPINSFSPRLTPLVHTLRSIANCVADFDGMAILDFRPDNVMRRPETGELVWSDPIWGPSLELTEEQSQEMTSVEHRVREKHRLTSAQGCSIHHDHTALGDSQVTP